MPRHGLFVPAHAAGTFCAVRTSRSRFAGFLCVPVRRSGTPRTKMPVKFTKPLRDEMTPALRRKIERAYREFPELANRRIVVGITKKRGLDGYAVCEDFCIRLNIGRRTGISYFTIGHELTHLLQKPGLGIVPDGEVQCDIWTLARSKLFLDEMPTYLDVDPCRDENWKSHARAVRRLCIRAIEMRTFRRRYIVWLRDRIGNLFTVPVQPLLFPPDNVLS